MLPVVAWDSVSGVLRSLLIDGIGISDIALVAGVVAMLAVPVVALWLLFADLTRFYFHANHLGGEGRDVFTPRFTLTSLMLPSDELGPAALEQLSAGRNDPRMWSCWCRRTTGLGDASIDSCRSMPVWTPVRTSDACTGSVRTCRLGEPSTAR